VRFGLRLLQHQGPPRELVRLASLAERAGFDQVWFSHDLYLHHAWALASAAAEETSRVGVGVVGTNPYTTHPAEIAAWAATLDELSQARALLGLGLHTGDMVSWVGHDPADVVDRTRTAAAEIRALWRGERDGRRYLRFQPRRAAIPVYVCAWGRAYLELAGEIGEGALPMVTPPESAARMIEPVRAGALAAGRDPVALDIAGCAWLSLAESRSAAADALRPVLAYFGPYLEEESLATVGLSRADFAGVAALVEAGRDEEAARSVTDGMLRLAIVGTPDDAVAAIGRLADAGVTQANLGGPLGPDPAEAIRLLGDRVIPEFR
jgi:5,10-methylenetetrahydromethanopterin reductase